MIQIFGTRKNRDTQKAVRFFKERRIPFQFIDLCEKGMSRGELESVARSVPLDRLIDSENAEYKKRGLAWQEFDPAEKLLNLIMRRGFDRLPVVDDTGAVVGIVTRRDLMATIKVMTSLKE